MPPALETPGAPAEPKTPAAPGAIIGRSALPIPAATATSRPNRVSASEEPIYIGFPDTEAAISPPTDRTSEIGTVSNLP